MAVTKATYWNSIWKGADSADRSQLASHPLRSQLVRFIERHNLQDALVLEVGCGIAALQDIVPHYTGVDFAPSASEFVRPPAAFVCASAEAMPFPNDTFGFVFSIYCLEHIAAIEMALIEIRRVTQPGGLIYLKPAWFCRPWMGREWFHKSWSQATWLERLLKLMARMRNTVVWRSIDLLSWRLTEACRRSSALRVRKLRANHDMPTIIDADAEVWLDPLSIVKWFESRGDKCLSHIGVRQRWLRTSDAVVIKKSPDGAAGA